MLPSNTSAAPRTAPQRPAPRALRVTVRALAAAAAVSLFAAGCGSGGGGNEDDYRTGLHRVGTDISKASTAVANLKPDAPDEDRAAAIDKQADAFSAAAKRADALEPPADARKDHATIVKELRVYATALHHLSDATLSNDSTDDTAAYSEAGEAAQKLNEASRRLDKLGYSLERTKRKSGGSGK